MTSSTPDKVKYQGTTYYRSDIPPEKVATCLGVPLHAIMKMAKEYKAANNVAVGEPITLESPEDLENYRKNIVMKRLQNFFIDMDVPKQYPCVATYEPFEGGGAYLVKYVY